MAITLEDYEKSLNLSEQDKADIETYKTQMLLNLRAYRLRELREEAGLTQAQVAARMGVGQRQVSKIENGEVENAKVSTLRKYLEAIGGNMSVDFIYGDTRFHVA